MASALIEIRLFSASPNDVAREREEAVRKIAEELNDGVARERGFVIRVLTWENLVPDLGRAQQVILDQIGTFDIFVGIMGGRFGSPTGQYESGTEEEFYKAYNTWLAVHRPRVLFYFKQGLERMPATEIEVEQISKVVKFRSEVQKLGLPRDYSDYAEFTKLFRRHLTDVILRWKEPQPEDAEKSIERGAAAIPFWRLWNEAFRKERSPGERPETWLYRSAEKSIKFFTISGRSIYSGDIEEILKEKSRIGLTVKLLLFDWNSPWLPVKMRDERRETDIEIQMSREKARGISQQLLSLSALPNLRLEIRLYREYPVWRFMIVDESRCYLGYYPKGKRGYEGPMFVFDRDSEASLFYPVNQYFDILWEKSGESLRQNDQRLELLPLSELTVGNEPLRI